MTPEDGLTETAPEPSGQLLDDGLASVAVEVGDATLPDELAAIKAEANPTAADLKSPW